MSSLQMPHIKIELDHMRQSIVHALGCYGRDMEQFVDDALREAVNRFDYRAAVCAEADKAIAEGVRSAVAWAIRDAFSSPELRNAVNLAVREAIVREMRELGK